MRQVVEARNNDFVWKAKHLRRCVLEYHLIRVWMPVSFSRTEMGMRYGSKVKRPLVLQISPEIQHHGGDMLIFFLSADFTGGQGQNVSLRCGLNKCTSV